MNLAAAGQLLRDLEAGVAAAHDEHAAFGQIRGAPVAGAVRLEDLGREAAGEGRHDRRLEWPGRDDHRVGANRPAVASSTKPSASLLNERTGVESSTGSSNCSAYRSR